MKSRPGRSVGPACKARLFWLPALLLLAAVSPFARAKCSMADLKAPSTYYGRLDDGVLVGATLWANGSSSALGGKFYAGPDFKDVEVSGALTDQDALKLYEKGSGKLLFDGAFLDHYQQRKDLTCDVFAGKAAGSHGVWSLDHINPLYGDFDPKTTALVDAAALAVQRAILADKPEDLAAHLHLPLKILSVVNGKTRLVVIKNRRSFLNAYPRLVSSKFKLEIQSAVPHDLFMHQDLFGMARGLVWLNGDGKIVSMNFGG